MIHLFALALGAFIGLVAYIVIDALLPIDPDLERPWHPEDADTSRLWR